MGLVNPGVGRPLWSDYSKPLADLIGRLGEVPDAPVFHKDFAGTRTLGADVTFTRASNATYTNSAGVITTATTDEARFDFDPVTRICRGLLIEEARTNLLLNSTIDGANLVTQNITTTAAARTLSFYGTGTVTLSGTHAATVVGTGAYPTRTTYTYTPTAGALTLTVSGTVQFANDELGSFATSFIPTDGTAKTRAADLCSVAGANFSSWYNQSEGTFVLDVAPQVSTAATNFILDVSNNSTAERHFTRKLVTSAQIATAMVDGGASQFDLTSSDVVTTRFRYAFGYKLNDCSRSLNGLSAVAASSATMPTPTQANIGSNFAGGSSLNGYISRITYYNKRLSDSTLRGLSA